MINDGDAFVDFKTVGHGSTVTLVALSVVLGERGGIVRDILAEKIAERVDVLARDTYSRFAQSVQVALPTSVRAVLGAVADGGAPIPAQLQPGASFFALPTVIEQERSLVYETRASSPIGS